MLREVPCKQRGNVNVSLPARMTRVHIDAITPHRPLDDSERGRTQLDGAPDPLELVPGRQPPLEDDVGPEPIHV